MRPARTLKIYQHVKHSGWGIHWNDINTGRLILQYLMNWLADFNKIFMDIVFGRD